MKICILTLRYPTVTEPAALTFVQQLAWQMADAGQEVEVVCPLPVSKIREYKDIPQVTIETTQDGNRVNVYHPRSVYLGQLWIGKWNTAYISTLLFRYAVDNIIRKMDVKPDILYGHFITPAGITACMLGGKYGIPSYVAYGESTPWTVDQIGRARAKELLKSVSGIVSVSTANKEELVQTGVIEPEKVRVFPNGYRPNRFFPKNKSESRKKFDLPDNAFIVAFVGHFIMRKGIHILLEAVNQIDGVYMICAGKGEISPAGDSVLFSGMVNPDDLADFYSAADCFVLPTVNEGCCNAIIEAMACGLPIISSKQSFNDDILFDDNSIRIDPKSVQAVCEAIVRLKENEDLRMSMAQASIMHSCDLTLDKRTEKILRYFENENRR